MKVEGGGHYLRAVNNGARTVLHQFRDEKELWNLVHRIKLKDL